MNVKKIVATAYAVAAVVLSVLDRFGGSKDGSRYLRRSRKMAERPAQKADSAA